MAKRYELTNCLAMAAKHVSFEVPPERERLSLQPGDLVKLVFVSLPNEPVFGERMWVEIVTRLGTIEEKLGEKPLYRGELRNRPATTDALAWGDLVEFGPEHIASIDRRIPLEN